MGIVKNNRKNLKHSKTKMSAQNDFSMLKNFGTHTIFKAPECNNGNDRLWDQNFESGTIGAQNVQWEARIEEAEDMPAKTDVLGQMSRAIGTLKDDTDFL